ncbi:MAG: hypothetical protein QOD14_238 [Solirubrobacterales bacterium]|nr:hypothetical protein [Solirubrobacterales bacterium]
MPATDRPSERRASPDRSDLPPPMVRRALAFLARRSTSVLTYHGVADLPLSEDPYRLMIPSERLRAQIAALRAAGVEFVTVAELWRRTVDGSPPHGLVALTFDDAFLNLLDPLLSLAEEGVPTTVYAVTDWIGGLHPRFDDPEHASILTGEQLRELAEAGVEIGGHTVSHPDLSTLTYRRCLDELRDCREQLESTIGLPVLTAAYPFGRYSEAAMRAAEEAGYQVAVAEEGGRGWEPLAMFRASLGRGESWPAFTVKATGRWQAISASGGGRLARSAVNRLRRRNGSAP